MIVKPVGPISFVVDLENGRQVIHHQDHLCHLEDAAELPLFHHLFDHLFHLELPFTVTSDFPYVPSGNESQPVKLDTPATGTHNHSSSDI